MSDEVPSVIREAVAEINRTFQRLAATDPVLRELFGDSSVPRYQFWRQGRTTYEYTTERCRGLHGEPDGFWAVERRWIKGQGRIVRSLRFVQRKKARARAYAWCLKARAVAAKRKATKAIAEIE